MTANEASRVVRNDDRGRFELFEDGELVGFATFTESAGTIEVPHVQIRNELRGRGYGSVLASGLLDDIRASQLRVVPTCPFLASYVREHASYQDLLAA